MNQRDLERDLEYAEQLERKGFLVWHTAVTELRDAIRPKTLGKAPHTSKPPLISLPGSSQQAAISAFAAEFRKIPSGRHPVYLALSGALLARGIDPNILPAFVGSVASQAGDAKTSNRISDAKSTASAWQNGGRVTGYTTLLTRWPAVAAAVDAHFPRPASKTERQLETTLATSTLARVVAMSVAQEMVPATLRAARENPATVRILASPPGTGKTRHAVEFALACDGKVAVVHGTNKVAIEHFKLAELQSPGTSKRRFGALSVVNPDGSLACKKGDLAGAIQRGGLSVQQRLCIRCEHRDSCPAREGVEGAHSARLAFFNHAMLDAAVEHAGANGLVVIDESPPPFIHLTLNRADLETTERVLRGYQFPFALARPCTPLVKLLREEATTAEHGDRLGSKLRAIADLATDRDHFDLSLAFGALGQFDDDQLDAFDQPTPVPRLVASEDFAGDAVAIFLAGLGQWPNHAAPPTTKSFNRQISSQFGTGGADDVATAARTLTALKLAFSGEPKGRSGAAWHVTAAAVEVRVTSENPSLTAALRRPGPTVLLDATVDELALRHLVRGPIHLEQHGVVDGAMVVRLLLANAKGAKRHLAPRKAAHWPVFGAALADALTHSSSAGAKNILIITHKVCAEALRTNLDRVPHVRLRQILQQLEAAGSRTLVGHFGDVRGRNEFDGVSWKDLDAAITVGDPWPDVGNVTAESGLLGFSSEDDHRRHYELAAAELGQAHGRLRAPRQTKPTVAIHVGSVVPAGWTATNTTLVRPVVGRRPGVTAMTQDELLVLVALVGGRRELGRVLGVAESCVRRYLQGRAIPLEFAARARDVLSRAAPDEGGVRETLATENAPCRVTP